jgi:ADP-heptose:LPS heptosyltransferase
MKSAALRIYDSRERALVAAADALLRPVAAVRRLRRRRPDPPARVLCLRLERIGDLLMTLPALAALRAALPEAAIDLVVGSWNYELARAIPGMTRVETLDAAWLTRGEGGLGTLALARRARRLRSRHYDLAINFEPDIRSNVALAAAARRTAGFVSGGGGALLDVALDYDPTAHTADNALRLVRRALGLDDAPAPAATLAIPDALAREAARLLQPLGDGPKIGMHVSGGRAIKQWPVERFHDVAERLIQDRSASIVFTGGLDDRELIDAARRGLPPDRVLDLTADDADRFRSPVSVDLVTVAAVLQQLALFVTGDTGPMHLAQAVGTPIVAVFGPSDPARYGPRGLRDRIVRVDLPCSPCNRIRRPPARCVGHTPDCLAAVATAAVLAAIDETLGERG